MTVKYLEELQCPNTAEVVIMWAWTIGVVNPVDHDGWQLIGRDTLRFYQTRGMERLNRLEATYRRQNHGVQLHRVVARRTPQGIPSERLF